jgi:molybdate transport system substrate-binding protein
VCVVNDGLPYPQPATALVRNEVDLKMRSIPSARPALLLGALILALAACSAGASSPPGMPSESATAVSSRAPATATPAARVELTIYGAASLKGALEKARTSYEAANPGTTLKISTDASSALETKIEQGAPADVFLSADTRNPQKLVDAGLAVGDPVPFAGNRLTVIVPAANPAGITTPADLAKSGVKVIAAGDAVPITTYADQLITNLAGEPGYPADFAAAYAANVVSREDNVKAVVAKLELGEGDAGIVYVTDAAASTRVAAIDVPDTANVVATYAGVVVTASPNAAAARAFLTWFAGPDGHAILGSFGFLPPS